MTEEEKGLNKVKLVKILSILFIAISWIVFIIIKTQTEIKSIYFLLVSIFITIGVIIFLSWGKIQDYIESKKTEKNTEDIPEPITEDEVYKKLNEEVEKRMHNHIEQPYGIPSKRTHNINKNLIYEFKVRLLHSEKRENKLVENAEYYIIINATYPQFNPTILPSTISKYELNKAINRMSRNPEPEPNVRESEERLDEFGRPIRKTKETQHTKKEKKKEEKKEDVL